MDALEIKFLGNDIISVDGVRMTLEVIKSAMNPSESAQRCLLSVKRIEDQLQFTSYWNSEEADKFFDNLKDPK